MRKLLAVVVLTTLVGGGALTSPALAQGDDNAQSSESSQQLNNEAEQSDTNAMREAVTNPGKATEDLGNAVNQGTDADRQAGRGR
jgi:hypothetical protein